MKTRTDAAGFAAEILSHDDILILTHSHPDGDTIGTATALLNALVAIGKNAAVACSDPLPDHIAFMADYTIPEKCFFGRPYDESFSPAYVVSVDIASAFLVGGELFEMTKSINLALDHHNTNTISCEKLYLEESSSSAGETLYFSLIEMEKLTGKTLIDKKTACALYSSISSDSGNFKYSNVNRRTMLVAGELISRGAENADISRKLFDIRSFASFKAEALCTQNARFFCDGKVVYSYIPKEILDENGIGGDELETCVQLLRMIKGVEVAIFAKIKPDPEGAEKMRLSLRSNEYVDVAAVCSEFDGGGHTRAAGCTIYGTPDEICEKIVKAVSERL